MSRQQKEPTWPFLSILACLFVLSAAAPRAWEKSIRTHDPYPSEKAVSETETRDAEKEVIACAEATNDELPSDQIQDDRSPTISLIAPAPARPLSTAGTDGFLVVAPSPRIGQQASHTNAEDLAGGEESASVESLELFPALPAAEFFPSDGESMLPAEESESGAEMESEWSADGEADLETLAELESPAASEDAAEVADDRDMSAVDGVSVLSEEDVAELAAENSGARENADKSVSASILEALEPLKWDCETGRWAHETTEAVTRASAELLAGSTTAKQSVAQLSALGRDGVALAKQQEETESHRPLAHVLMMLHRRVEIWEQLAAVREGQQNRPEPVNWQQVRHAVERIKDLTAGAENGSAWDSFLELDALSRIVGRAEAGLTGEDRTLVQYVILKLQVKDVSEEQRKFLASQDVVDFERALRTVAAEPIDVAAWLTSLEDFERTGSKDAAEHLAVERLKLSVSSLPAQVELARRIEGLYCASNVRIAVTGYLLNRLLPDREPEYQWVRDTVLGHPVRGRSTTIAEVGVALIPDPHRMRAALTVDGIVSASTSSTAGPATFFSGSESEYSAVKELELTAAGIRFRPAEVTVDNRMWLRQVRTEFDGVPLLSALAQSVARSQHEANRPAIRREMNRKVQYQAEKQIDEEIDARLGELNDRLQERLLNPLAAMSLRPEVIEAQTTEARLAMELRLAGPNHLAGNTPRPWAPSDSVLSFQVHQSALNNVLCGLQLDGATLTIKELRDRIATTFNRPELLEETTENDDVLVTFAENDAARIDFEDGRVAVSLGVSRLRADNRQWRDFRVRAYYRPEMSSQSATLVRDGVVELIGPMRMASQIALRGIFSKTFAKGRDLPIVPQEIAADPRLQGLQVTQVLADDGWFALAIGPERIQPAVANSTGPAAVK